DVRGLDLAGGKELWRGPTRPPSRRGAASGNVYFLPPREAAGEKGAALVAPDGAQGQPLFLIPPQKNPDRRVGQARDLPFPDGHVLSQTATELIAYPLLKARLNEIDELLKKTPPGDPTGLFERGELRLEQGNYLGAVEDFRAALANKPTDDLRPKLRGKLFDA